MGAFQVGGITRVMYLFRTYQMTETRDFDELADREVAPWDISDDTCGPSQEPVAPFVVLFVAIFSRPQNVGLREHLRNGATSWLQKLRAVGSLSFTFIIPGDPNATPGLLREQALYNDMVFAPPGEGWGGKDPEHDKKFPINQLVSSLKEAVIKPGLQATGYAFPPLGDRGGAPEAEGGGGEGAGERGDFGLSGWEGEETDYTVMLVMLSLSYLVDIVMLVLCRRHCHHASISNILCGVSCRRRTTKMCLTNHNANFRIIIEIVSATVPTPVMLIDSAQKGYEHSGGVLRFLFEFLRKKFQFRWILIAHDEVYVHLGTFLDLLADSGEPENKIIGRTYSQPGLEPEKFVDGLAFVLSRDLFQVLTQAIWLGRARVAKTVTGTINRWLFPFEVEQRSFSRRT